MDNTKTQLAGVDKTGGDVGAELEYIARMSQELANMAYKLDRKFVAYLLNMASMAAREEAAEAGKTQAPKCFAE
jgi:hypothetical protein